MASLKSTILTADMSKRKPTVKTHINREMIRSVNKLTAEPVQLPPRSEFSLVLGWMFTAYKLES